MNRIKPQGWPDTGRTYPEGALLHVFETPEFYDLAYYDAQRALFIYLSTRKK